MNVPHRRRMVNSAALMAQRYEAASGPGFRPRPLRLQKTLPLHLRRLELWEFFWPLLLRRAGR